MAAATISNTKMTGISGESNIAALLARGVRIEVGILTFDGGDYATNGIAWEPENIPADKVENVFFTCPSGYQAEWDGENHMVKVWVSTTEYSNASAISLVFGYFAIGKPGR
jgi:hypothetical protein